MGHAYDLENTHLLDFVGGVVGHEADAVTGADGAFLDAEMDDRAPERVVMGIENQGRLLEGDIEILKKIDVIELW